MNREQALEKAKAFVRQMTLEEKISQLCFASPAIERLGIPAYNWWNEALHGVARAGAATMFPQAIGLAATFNDNLLQKTGDVIATEGRAKFNAYSAQGDRDIYKGLTFWSPNVNIFRDPRWGRGQETYGEDPYLTARLGVAFTKGLQGEGETLKAAACAKHFAAHSGPEAIRHSFDASASEKDMAETYLPAFEALVKEAGVEAVMGAYNRLNGEPCCGDRRLLADLLRGQWGFEGHVVSDCLALPDFHLNHKVTANGEETAAKALLAGCDLDCGNTYVNSLLPAFEQGLVEEQDIDRAAVRLFATRHMLGLFEGSEYDAIPYTALECEEHLALAERAAAESVVLLKNDGLLPLDTSKMKTLGVIGPNANSRAALVGNYHGTSSEYITLLDGIRREAGGTLRILYSQGSALAKDKVEPLANPGDRLTEARIVAEQSDVVVLCLGLNETLEGEEGDAGNSYASGDKPDLLLPAPQRALMEAVAAVGKPVLLCVMTGSAMDLRFAERHFGAILQLWYPGARGGKAVAEILFGKVAPTGKLPVTFYRSAEGLPPFTDYGMKNRTYRYIEEEPLYPFGYGLTYGNLRLLEAKAQNLGNGKAEVAVLLENPGFASVQDTVQVYIENPSSGLVPPHPVLCAFKKVSLQPGKKQKYLLTIGAEGFMAVDDTGKRIYDGVQFALHVGFSQPDARSQALMGQAPIVVNFKLEI